MDSDDADDADAPMSRDRAATGKPRPWRRWAGRSIGAVASMVWILVLVASLVGEPDAHAADSATLEGTLVVVLVTANVGAFVVTLRRERFGSRVLAVTAAALGVFALWSAGRNQLLALGVSAGPFALAAALLWSAGERTR